jgi:PhnB protein
MELHPYLSFSGDAGEAIELYAKALGGNVEYVTTYADHPEQAKDMPKDWHNKVMHASMRAGDIVIMASDVLAGCGSVQELLPHGSPISLSINCHSVEELQNTYEILVSGGNSTMEPQDTFWGARFAMLEDKFGIKWMLNYDYPKPE